MTRIVLLMAAVALVAVGCGSRDRVDIYLDSLDNSISRAMAFIDSSKPHSSSELNKLPEWEKIRVGSAAVNDSLRRMRGDMTTAQSGRYFNTEMRIEVLADRIELLDSSARP